MKKNMHKHFLSIAALGIMIILAVGSVGSDDAGGGANNNNGNNINEDDDSGGGGNSSVKIFKENETANIGYTSYKVLRTWWSKKVSNNQFVKPANAMYLMVEIIVRNDDKKARTIAPFKLIDENNAEYDTSVNGIHADNALGLLTDLNPGVSKQGVIAFDTLQDKKYKLKISGGYWSTDEALIELNPK